PATDETPTYVLGVNASFYQGEAIISNASCTTNCLAPLAKIIDEEFGIQMGLMTTIHSYTNDQNLLDVAHRDFRRARAAATNIIPTTTGAARAIGRVLPRLEGRLHGQSVRVPVPDVSMIDLNVVTEQPVTADELNTVVCDRIERDFQGLVAIDRSYGVSQDFIGCSASAIFVPDLTQSIGDHLVKVMAWYDNEWGYANRLLEMALHITHFNKESR
ncbi:MAG: type I glyceraldehyde-3-phosphate dehydrogenase, partial [Campylobacterales bacterium]